jgi:hypothetical protein
MMSGVNTHQIERLDNKARADARNAACSHFFDFDGIDAEFASAPDSRDSFACRDFFTYVEFGSNLIDRACILLEI